MSEDARERSSINRPTRSAPSLSCLEWRTRRDGTSWRELAEQISSSRAHLSLLISTHPAAPQRLARAGWRWQGQERVFTGI